ncbi:unnamed protein product [Scytosiphon promiscuus]
MVGVSRGRLALGMAAAGSLLRLFSVLVVAEAFVATPRFTRPARGRDGENEGGGACSRRGRREGAVLMASAGGEPVPGKSMLRSRAVGIGSSAPATVLPNSDLEELVETSDEWIATRTGIRKRHLLKEGQGVTDLAISAANNALELAGVDGSDIDLVVMATSSPDDMFGDACVVANAVGAKGAVAFDLTAACSGFLFGLVTASQFLHSGTYKKCLVIGADALSRWVDWEDRNSCILFGDGAGAMVLEAAEGDDGAGLLGFSLHSDGGGHKSLTLGYDGAERKLGAGKYAVTKGSYGSLGMEGREVYKFATREVPKVLTEALDNAGMEVEDVDWLLLHQANIRIMETVASRLGISMDKVITNLAEYGNTSAGSIPLALDEAVRSGKVKSGDVIACAGFGAGLSWGAAIIRWSG